jgi:hypothetical protein
MILRTVPAMFVTLVGFIAARMAFAAWVRPHLLAPMHQAAALDPATTGYGVSGSLLSVIRSSPSLQPAPPNMPNAWIISLRIVDDAGTALTSQVLQRTCPGIGERGQAPLRGGTHGPAPASARQAMQDCVTKIGATYHQVVTYQPADRYWTLQWIELALYLGAALVLGGFCLWWVRSRLT